MLVALLQPAPETYKLFDDVLLLASGMVSRLNCMEPAQDGCLAALQSLRAAANWPGHGCTGISCCAGCYFLGKLGFVFTNLHLPTILAGAVPRSPRGCDALLPLTPGL